jgi:hypothetical protein
VDRSTFAKRLSQATTRAHDFAQTLVVEHLPASFKYRVRLNSSYDRNPLRGDEMLYPDDGSAEAGRRSWSLGFAEAMDLLWRDGSIPEWINVSAVDAVESWTVIELRACGRFTRLDELLYHHEQGLPPFEIHSPAYPASTAGEKPHPRFSIHHNPACRIPEDVYRLAFHSEQVESLELFGPGIDESMLEHLPAMLRLRFLKLAGVTVRGTGFSALHRHPELMRLQLAFGNDDSCDFSLLPELPNLTSLELDRLPAAISGLNRLYAGCPALKTFHASSSFMPRIEEPVQSFPHHQFGFLTLRFPRLPEPFLSCVDDVFWLTLSLAEVDEARLIDLCSRYTGLANLNLDGSPVTDRLLVAAVDWNSLVSLDVVDTAVTVTGILHFCISRPDVKVTPNLDDADSLVSMLRHTGLLGEDGRPEELPQWNEWNELISQRPPTPNPGDNQEYLDRLLENL